MVQIAGHCDDERPRCPVCMYGLRMQEGFSIINIDGIKLSIDHVHATVWHSIVVR